MDYLKIINKAICKKHKAECVIRGTGKIISEMIKNQILEQYAHTKVNRNKNEFEFFNVRTWAYDLGGKPKVRAVLYYTGTYKMPKEKKEKLDSIKKNFEETDRMQWTNHSIPLFVELSYELDADEYLKDEIRLNLNDN